VVSLVLYGGAALVAAFWLAVVLMHVDDGYGIDHVAGTWISLARYANEGTLYPPLYDGESFGGTRFMPVPILLQAGAAQVTGEYVVSAKILSALMTIALASFVLVLLRRRTPLPVALVLTSTLLVTGTGLVAALSIRNDALPLMLQLLAVTVVASSVKRETAVVAGLLCALAFLCKLSAIWAPLAIVVWLARRSPRRLAEYVGALAIGLVVGLLAAELVSDGRFGDNLLGLATTSSERYGSISDQLARLRLVGREGFGPLVVLPVVAAIGTVIAVRRHVLTLYHVAFLAATLVTAAVLVDPGAFVNHLLDVHVLSLLVIGELIGRPARARTAPLSWAALALAVVVAASAATFFQDVRRADSRPLVGRADSDERVPRLATAIEAGDRVLSEDPFVPASRGMHPVILDPYMLLSLVGDHPDWQRDVIRRIDRREFDKVVLFYLPDEARLWYERVHLGTPVVRAIERNYRPAEFVDGYWVYVPRRP
jgi:ABC-type amino acid transport system permease subunit